MEWYHRLCRRLAYWLDSLESGRIPRVGGRYMTDQEITNKHGGLIVVDESGAWVEHKFKA